MINQMTLNSVKAVVSDDPECELLRGGMCRLG